MREHVTARGQAAEAHQEVRQPPAEGRGDHPAEQAPKETAAGADDLGAGLAPRVGGLLRGRGRTVARSASLPLGHLICPRHQPVAVGRRPDDRECRRGKCRGACGPIVAAGELPWSGPIATGGRGGPGFQPPDRLGHARRVSTRPGRPASPPRAGSSATRPGSRRTVSPTRPIATCPTLAAAPSSPARNGRDASGHASATRATAFGHAPPIPMQAANRTNRSPFGSSAVYAASVNPAWHRTLPARAPASARTRRPTHPKTQPAGRRPEQEGRLVPGEPSGHRPLVGRRAEQVEHHRPVVEDEQGDPEPGVGPRQERGRQDVEALAAGQGWMHGRHWRPRGSSRRRYTQSGLFPLDRPDRTPHTVTASPPSGPMRECRLA